MIYRMAFGGALSAVIVAGVLFLAPPSALAQTGFGYGGGALVTVCKTTRSVFMPYVKVAVPAAVAERFLAQGGILLDAQGNCPRGVSITEYVFDRLQSIFR